jgi:rRNA maturation endonuclease Nob1
MYHLLSFFRRKTRKKLSGTIFSTRPEHALVCPLCSAVMSRDEDSCRSCGVMFIILDETNRFPA